MTADQARRALLLGGALVAAVASVAQAQQVSDVAGVQGQLRLDLLDFPAEKPLTHHALEAAQATPGIEIELTAPAAATGIPLDISIAQRAGYSSDEHGAYDTLTRGAEVRVGRALGEPRGGMSQAPSRVYVFAASDNEALTWRPGQPGHALALQQDRVEIGDRQAGVTYERNGLQASLAYVEREVSATVGRTTTSQDENFAGFTLTMRR